MLTTFHLTTLLTITSQRLISLSMCSTQLQTRGSMDRMIAAFTARIILQRTLRTDLQNIIIMVALSRKSWASSLVVVLVPSRGQPVLPRLGEEWPVGTQDYSLVPGVVVEFRVALAQEIKGSALLLQRCLQNSNNSCYHLLKWSHNSNKFSPLLNKTSAITSNRKM